MRTLTATTCRAVCKCVFPAILHKYCILRPRTSICLRGTSKPLLIGRLNAFYRLFISKRPAENLCKIPEKKFPLTQVDYTSLLYSLGFPSDWTRVRDSFYRLSFTHQSSVIIGVRCWDIHFVYRRYPRVRRLKERICSPSVSQNCHRLFLTHLKVGFFLLPASSSAL